MSKSFNNHYEVAIVGYGPVGATAANLLGKMGLKSVIIEKEFEIYDKPRAITFDQETMRVFQSINLVKEILPFTTQYRPAHYLGMEGQVIRQIYPAPPPFPLHWLPNYLFDQPGLEGILRRGASSYTKNDIKLGYNLISLQPHETYINMHIEAIDTGHTEYISADYVWACDGASSPIRKQLGITLEDLEFSEQWLVIDAHVKDPSTLPEVNIQYCEPKRPSTYVIGPKNHRRWELMLMPGDTEKNITDHKRILELLGRWGKPSNFRIRRASVYHFRALVAAKWRQDRIFLLGDAAHQTPPFMGQGMCSGIRDAWNLAWKLELVTKYSVSQTLFDSYEEERKPHVKTLTHTAKELGEIICMTDPIAAKKRDIKLKAELDRGKMVTVRQDLIPNLTGGFIQMSQCGTPLEPAGQLFYQPLVGGMQGEKLPMDDVTRKGFLLVTIANNFFDNISPNILAWFRSIGGQLIILNNTTPPALHEIIMLDDLNGVLTKIFEEYDCRCLIVRPDRYIFGACNDPDSLDKMLIQMKNTLNAESSS